MPKANILFSQGRTLVFWWGFFFELSDQIVFHVLLTIVATEPSRRHLLGGSGVKGKLTWRSGQTIENISVMATLRPEYASLINKVLGPSAHMSDL